MPQLTPSYVFHHTLFGKLRNLEIAILMLTGLLEAMLTPLAGPVLFADFAGIVVSHVHRCRSHLLPAPGRSGLVAPRLHADRSDSGFSRQRFRRLSLVSSAIHHHRRQGSLDSATARSDHAPGLDGNNACARHADPAFDSARTSADAGAVGVSAVSLRRQIGIRDLHDRGSRSRCHNGAHTDFRAGKPATGRTTGQRSGNTGRVSERTRIAREIHDALGHTLTSLNIQLEVARKLASRDVAKSHEALDSAKQLASQSLNDVRRALNMIMPSRGEAEFDLNEALPVLARQVEQNQPIKITLELDEVKLPSTKSHHVYCIVRECLTNIQRHARATNIGIALKLNADKILVEVNDDGKGFDPAEPSAGFGISGMRERVEHLGGTLAIESSPGVGTKVQVSVPC